MEMDCHERTCRYGGVCEYDSEGLPYCACAFQCPVIFDPVCGSDGRLHDNECKLKEEACKQQKSVMPVHIEMCEGEEVFVKTYCIPFVITEHEIKLFLY